MRVSVGLLIAVAVIVASGARPAAAQTPLQYGPPISIGQAKKVMAAAEAEAQAHNWPVAISIVDTHGMLVMFQRQENTQIGSVDLSLEKAKTSALSGGRPRPMKTAWKKAAAACGSSNIRR